MNRRFFLQTLALFTGGVGTGVASSLIAAPRADIYNPRDYVGQFRQFNPEWIEAPFELEFLTATTGLFIYRKSPLRNRDGLPLGFPVRGIKEPNLTGIPYRYKLGADGRYHRVEPFI